MSGSEGCCVLTGSLRQPFSFAKKKHFRLLCIKRSIVADPGVRKDRSFLLRASQSSPASGATVVYGQTIHDYNTHMSIRRLQAR